MVSVGGLGGGGGAGKGEGAVGGAGGASGPVYGGEGGGGLKWQRHPQEISGAPAGRDDPPSASMHSGYPAARQSEYVPTSA